MKEHFMKYQKKQKVQFMNTNEFRIITNLKKFIISLDNILINFPKKEKVLKDKIKETSYEVLELIEYTNLITDKINYQYQIISKLSMLDFYFEESLKKKYISEKQCKNKCNELLIITKMVYGWIRNGK